MNKSTNQAFFSLLLFFRNNLLTFKTNNRHVRMNSTNHVTARAIIVNDSGSFESSIWFSRSSQWSASTFVPFGIGHGCCTIISCLWTCNWFFQKYSLVSMCDFFSFNGLIIDFEKMKKNSRVYCGIIVDQPYWLGFLE